DHVDSHVVPIDQSKDHVDDHLSNPDMSDRRSHAAILGVVPAIVIPVDSNPENRQRHRSKSNRTRM
ncbi:hypothetical protein BHE74_00015630, partial [Ensete ventricosum]